VNVPIFDVRMPVGVYTLTQVQLEYKCAVLVFGNYSPVATKLVSGDTLHSRIAIDGC